MKKGQAHPSALTSKRMISEALIEIIKEKEYKDITITEVCTRAQISRRTFYRNFETMDDVLVFFTRTIIDEFKIEMKKHADENLNKMLVSYFTFWNTQSDLLNQFIQKGLSTIIFIEYIKGMDEIFFLNNCSVFADKSNESPFLQAFLAGGLWSLLNYYVSHNCEATPQELADILLQQQSFLQQNAPINNTNEYAPTIITI
ncbi:MAG TPA: TetR/AcrR family transcriptional regulator [Lachnospiraceae bacterium]|nr:TetR/AcrR family transcriptional regulator [Lachnospiraceae bacterium]